MYSIRVSCVYSYYVCITLVCISSAVAKQWQHFLKADERHLNPSMKLLAKLSATTEISALRK